MIPLINVSDLTRYIEDNVTVDAWAEPTTPIAGFSLHLKIDGEHRVLSTYLSTTPRHFKRADALLKEATKMGIQEVNFIKLLKE